MLNGRPARWAWGRADRRAPRFRPKTNPLFTKAERLGTARDRLASFRGPQGNVNGHEHYEPKPPLKPSPVGSFSRTNPPISSGTFRRNSIVHSRLHSKCRRKTVGSFRRNT